MWLHGQRGSAFRLRAGDERVGDRVVSVGRRTGGLVHRHEDDVARRLERRRVLAAALGEVGLHHVDPDRQGSRRARLAVAQRLLLVVPEPHADRDVGIEADEPRVGVLVHRPRLARDRPVERGRGGRRASRRDALQQRRHHVGRVGADRVVRLGMVLLEHVALAIDHAQSPGRATCGCPGAGTPCRPMSPRAASPPLRPGPARGTAGTCW